MTNIYNEKLEGDRRMSETEKPQLYDYDAAAAYCGFCGEADKAYFVGLHKEGRGPSAVLNAIESRSRQRW